MSKRQKCILVGLITGASLFVLALYSPFGSPDLYKLQNYILVYQGVNFADGIVNAPRFNSSYQSNEQQQSFPAYNSGFKSTSVFLVSNANASYEQFKDADERTPNNYTVSTLREKGEENSTCGIIGGIASTFRSNASKDRVVSQQFGFNSLTTDLNLMADNTLRQNVDPINTNQGLMDPGNDDDMGNMIPVGDGWGFLLLLALGYGLWNKIKLLQHS